MRQQRDKCNYATVQQQQQRQPQQQLLDNCMRRSRKKRNKCNNNASKTMAITTTNTSTSTDTCNYNYNYNNNNNNCNFNKINKLLLITAAWLLITMATTTLCQIEAATLASSSMTLGAGASLPLAAASTAALSASFEARQQRQLQQQQLFALLTKRQGGSTAATATTTGRSRGGAGAGGDGGDGDGGTSGSFERRFANAHHVQLNGGDEDDDDDRDHDRNHSDDNVAPITLETHGFVADDGQQYEKAEKVLAEAAAAVAAATAAAAGDQQHAAAGENVNDCPKECKCLNDYFDCGKQHLDRVPRLPNYVQILDLVRNKLNDTSVLEIRDLPDLHKLILKRNQLENVPKLSGLVALKQLNLANNRIQRIDSEALAAMAKLKSLDLSRNYLHTLELSYFPPTNRLAHLILNGNQIANIDENAFEHAGELLDLELNSNRLSTLPAGVFKRLNKLRKLSLNANHVEINWSTFRGLHTLQKLCLRSNNIRALQDGVFHVMRSIETIELDDNKITSLSRQGLFNLTKLHHLSLSNNSIARIEPDTWEFTQSLMTLDLSLNNISEFRPQHLDCLQRLRRLNLGHNKIQYLVDGTFDCVKNLEDLNLRRNRLAWIIEDQGATPLFRALRKLKRLDLYGNNLKQINSKSLSGLSSLESLNLGGNALATIQSGAFDHMSQLQKFTFKSLNFICDCDLLWFRRWLQQNAGANVAQMQANAVCGYPDHLLDRELLSLTPAELICADTPKPAIVQEPSNQLTVKGANLTMECIAVSPAAASLAAADELKIRWRHDQQTVRERTTETQIHHDQSTNQTTIIGYMRLQNVSSENAGKYQCVVSNAFGTTYSQKFKISIGIHPTFKQIPSNLTIDSGDTARLVCSASGDPTPEMALQKFGASDFPAATERRLQVIREENAFVITNAKPIDTGIYTCTAESAAGEIKINASLIVNDKPQAPIPLVRMEIVVGASTVLECLNELAADMQRPHREWLKDNKPFHTSQTSASKRYYYADERKLLVILDTQSMDAGHYRCDITDQSKTYTVQTELIVVSADFGENIVIIGLVLETFVCFVVGSLCVWAILSCHKRKLNKRNVRDSSNGTTGGSGGGVGGGDAGVERGSNHLDETQLTTLNRTYLQQARPLKAAIAQRPRSLADFDLSGISTRGGGSGSGGGGAGGEQRSCLIVSGIAPSYQQLLQRNVGAERDAGGGLTLEYLRRSSTALGGADGDHQLDHLSSKDSGTGSDAAVKRSLDDFTLALLPPSAATAPPLDATPQQRDVNKPPDGAEDSMPDGEEELDDAELVYAATHALGVSEYDIELSELSRASSERELFLKNNNYVKLLQRQRSDSRSDNDEDYDESVELGRGLNNCKAGAGGKFTANSMNVTSQAVDI